MCKSDKKLAIYKYLWYTLNRFVKDKYDCAEKLNSGMIFPAREFTDEPPKMQTLQTKGETFRQ